VLDSILESAVVYRDCEDVVGGIADDEAVDSEGWKYNFNGKRIWYAFNYRSEDV